MIHGGGPGYSAAAGYRIRWLAAERASVACTQKILRILLLRAENPARGLQEIARDFQRISCMMGALRAQILQCVSAGGWLSASVACAGAA
jgi:hypothetical protein